jgi:pimeloyl-ACP methyl ester carboxylesterase
MTYRLLARSWPSLAALAAIFMLSGCGDGADPASPAAPPVDTAQAEGIATSMPAADYTGSWEGTLNAGGQSIRMIFHVSDDGGALSATFDSPDQGAIGIEATSAGVVEGNLIIGFSMMAAEYRATLVDGELDGTWSQGGGKFDLDMAPLAAPEVDAGAAAVFEPVMGIWEGKLNAGGANVRLVFHIEDSDYGPVASLDSPDQGQKGIPVREVTFDGEYLALDIAAIGARYEAKWVDGALEGTWKQGGGEIPFNMEKVDEVAAADRPQNPEPPFPYAIEEVRFGSRADDAVLAGTLTLPQGEGPFPAAILITGSGQQDRDETIFEHKPFWVIADFLSRHGVAVLRYDDRGVFESTGDLTNATTALFAQDALGAVDLLGARDDIASIGMIGHSEGGAISDLAAVADDRIAWTVRLAGASVSGREILMEQAPAVFRANGADESLIAELLEINTALYDIVLAGDDPETARQKATAYVEGKRAELDDATQAALGLNEADKMLATLQNPWFLQFLAYDPAQDLRSLDIPVLALYGGKDVQVLASQNEPVARELLQHPDSRTHVYPGLNHLFQTADTGAPAEYGQITETISPQVLEDILEWIQGRG